MDEPDSTSPDPFDRLEPAAALRLMTAAISVP